MLLKQLRTFASVAVLAAALAPSLASAQYQDVVRDSNGNVVVDSNGNCVRTKWDVATENCTNLSLDQEARTVYFEFGKATLTPEAKRRLDALVSQISAAGHVESVDIVGHADAIGDSKANQRLSQRRAEAVKKYIAKSGKVRVNKTRVQALGESASVSECDKGLSKKDLVNCLWRDRRVEVMLNLVK